MATVADFYEALNHYVADAEKLRLIVQGDETTVVSTMFGPIDSVAKTIAEIEAEINAAGTGWLALAEAAADDANEAKNDAIAAAMASGIDAFANTYADAQTAAGSLPVGDSIMIFDDENASNSLTIRLVESGGTLSDVKANLTTSSGVKEYDANTEYTKGDFVTSSGKIYVAKEDNPGSPENNATAWLHLLDEAD